VCIGLQGPINSLLGRHVGLLESTFIVLVSGSVVTGALLLLGLGGGSLATLGRAPLVSLTGGVIGILIVMGVVVTIRRLGAAAGVAVVLVAQLGVSSAIDHFGLFGLDRRPVSPWTLAGIALLVAGAIVMRR
jgi:transporter family-2 protein